MRYKAFISYGHAADGRLAPALQAALQRFTKRWYQLRAMSVFRDDTDLSLTPDLWSSIERALADSEFFILFASPDAAASGWVGKEIDHWLRQRSAETILIVLTDGEMVWDPAAGDFDRRRSTAVPPSLHGAFAAEPLFLDMRWARRAEDLSLRDLEFRDGVASLAATLHGRPKSELVGEDVRQQRRTRRLAWSAVITVSLLALAASIAAVVAVQQRREAERQAEIALARQLAAQAELLRAQRAALLPRSVLLAIESMRLYRSEEADQALRNGLALMPRPLAVFAHDQAVVAARLTPDGRRLATADRRGTVRLWDVASGEVVVEMRHSRAAALAFAAEARFLATAGGDGTVRIWDAQSGREVARLEQGQPVTDLLFTPDGRRLITATSAGPATVWTDWRQGGRRAGDVTGGYSRVLGIGPDGETLAMVGRSYESVQLFTGLSFEGAAAQPSAGVVVSHDDNVTAVELSPDGRLLATASDDGTARVWEAASGRERLRLGHENVVSDVAFDAAGRRLATASADRTARVWSAASGEELLRMPHGGRVAAVSFGGGGRLLATGGWDRTARLWELTGGGETRWPLAQPAAAVAFSPDGRYLAAASWSGRVWDVAAGREIGEARYGNRVLAVAFSPDGRYLLTAGAGLGGAAKLWRSPAGELVAAFGRGSAGRAAFSPDSTRLALSSGQGGQAVSVPAGDPLYELAAGRDVAFSPDGRLLATAEAEGVRLRDAASGRELALLAHPDGASAVAFGPDGRLLASAGGDRAVRLWQVEERRQVAAFDHAGKVGAVAFSPGGGYLATAAGDDTARIWQLASGRRVAQLSYRGSDQALSSVAFSPDGRYLATGGGRRDASNNTVRLWLWRPEELIAEACGRLTRNLTRQEWRRSLGDRAYRESCPGLPVEG